MTIGALERRRTQNTRTRAQQVSSFHFDRADLEAEALFAISDVRSSVLLCKHLGKNSMSELARPKADRYIR